MSRFMAKDKGGSSTGFLVFHERADFYNLILTSLSLNPPSIPKVKRVTQRQDTHSVGIFP